MRTERPQRPELEPAVVAAYAATFISRRDLYPIQLPNGEYRPVRKALTDNMVEAHLMGNITIGAFALDPNGWAKWICFDADNEERWMGVVEMGRRLSTAGAIPYLEPSRRGGHLWFFTDPIPGFQIRRFGQQLLTEHDLMDVEIYPKQDRPTTGPGSLVRLPLGVHQLTGKRYHFINLDGTPLAPTVREQIRVFANPERVPMVLIDRVLERAPDYQRTSPTLPFMPKRDQDMSGPPSERIKAAISVHDFVSQYVELDEQGKGTCPFHQDEQKSFQVNLDGNYWNCYAGCGGGSIIDFWMKWREIHNQKADFKSTIRDLANMLL